jgi:large subunit ribosomal protein L4
MAVATYTKSGAKATTPAKLDKDIFGLEVKSHQLLKDAYLSQTAGARLNNAVTKRRGEVRGGGRKPWRQKGTGNARVGSSRTPLWRGGGIIFGPTGQENYTRKLNVSAKRLAIRQALSLAAKEDRIKVIETFACPDGKVKPTIQLLKKLGTDGSVLIVVSVRDNLVNRATANLPKVSAVQANYLSVYDVMNADNLVISKKSLDIINEWLGDK